jgi:hypothetical protein
VKRGPGAAPASPVARSTRSELVLVAEDVFCSTAFAKVYTSKLPITAGGLLYERVLPFHSELGVKVGAVLTDNGREFFGRHKQHPYELRTPSRASSSNRPKGAARGASVSSSA